MPERGWEDLPEHGDAPNRFDVGGLGARLFGGPSATLYGDPGIPAPTERLPIYEAVLSQWFEATDTTGAHKRSGEVAPSTNGGGEPASAEEAAEVPEPQPWTSPGDEGWQAARALLESTEEDALTTAGLPKRVPKAHLVPGSAAPRHEAAEPSVATPLPPRSAEAVRGRMSSFQQGVRRGRHALIDAYAGDQSGSDQSHHNEEQE